VDARRRALIPVRHASIGRGADVSFHDLFIPGARVTSARDPYPCLFSIASQEFDLFPSHSFYVVFGSQSDALFRLPQRLQCSSDVTFAQEVDFQSCGIGLIAFEAQRLHQCSI